MHRSRIALVAGTVLSVVVLALVGFAGERSAPAGWAPPAVRHVFVVNLENKSFPETFGPASAAPYLARTLTSQGQLLDQYYGIGHNSLGNYIAQISGQAPNIETQGDCPLFRDFVDVGTAADGQAIGQGCVYPARIDTLANQLTRRGYRWRGYMEDMANTPTAPSTCRHPAIGAPDDTQRARTDDSYATRHNPFVYFHAIIDTPDCARNVVNLDELPGDLVSAKATPNLVYITPDLCHDGHDDPCADGSPGGLPAIDIWLRSWIPRILASPAYRRDGLLIVTFDEAETAGDGGDAAACCGEVPGPNSPLPGITGPGGGRTGTVVLSRWTRPGRINATPYNHYSLLRSIEDLFALPHLGYAGRPGLTSFGPDVFDAAGAH